MSDTLEWLETIGSDASLRYLPAAQLGAVLRAGEASRALLQAVAEGSGEALRREFGIHHVPNTVQTDEPGFGDDPGEDGEAPVPGGGEGDGQERPKTPPDPAPRPSRGH